MKLLALLLILSCTKASPNTAPVMSKSDYVAKLSAQIITLKLKPRSQFNKFLITQLQDELSVVITQSR